MIIVILIVVLLTLLGCKSTEKAEFDLCKDDFGQPRISQAAWLVKIEPKYPKDAWDNDIRGHVKLKFIVGTIGHTEKRKQLGE